MTHEVELAPLPGKTLTAAGTHAWIRAYFRAIGARETPVGPWATEYSQPGGYAGVEPGAMDAFSSLRIHVVDVGGRIRLRVERRRDALDLLIIALFLVLSLLALLVINRWTALGTAFVAAVGVLADRRAFRRFVRRLAARIREG